MKKTLLLLILNKYADWEAAYVSALTHALSEEKYSVQTVSLTKDSVKSIGGFTVLPDYDIYSVPAEYEGLILIGGMSWRGEAARQVIPLVEKALADKKVLGGICDAAGFLGTIGVLNQVRHTANEINDLKLWAKDAYTGEANYECQPAVRDGKIVTAGGTFPMEFAREVVAALKLAPEEKILEWYNFHKLGFYNAPMPGMG